VNKDRVEYIRYRLARARETVEEARVMVQTGHLFGAAIGSTTLASTPCRPCCGLKAFRRLSTQGFVRSSSGTG
jgi:hypothetical protein